MPSNKYSFAVVLDDIEQQQRHSIEDAEWPLSANRASWETTKHNQSPVEDEFYLDPEPPAPAPISRPSSRPASRPASRPVSPPPPPPVILSPPVPKPLLRRAKSKPANITIPNPALCAQNEWPLPSPKPSPAIASPALRAQKSTPVFHSPSMVPSPALPSPEPSPFQDGYDTDGRSFYYEMDGDSDSGTTISEGPKKPMEQNRMSLAEFLKNAPASVVEEPALPPRPSTAKSEVEFGVKKNVHTSLADFLNEPEPKSPGFSLLPKSPTFLPKSPTFSMAKSTATSLPRSPATSQPKSPMHYPPKSPGLVSERSFGSKKTDGLSLADFLKAIPPPPPIELRPQTSSTHNSSSAGTGKSKISFFRGFKSFGRTKARQESGQDSRKDSRKDSSSLSSYQARTKSTPASIISSRTSYESTGQASRGSHSISTTQPTTSEQLPPQPEIAEEKVATVNTEPLVQTPHIVNETFPAFKMSEVPAVPSLPTDADSNTDMDMLSNTDILSDNGAQTETDMHDDSDMFPDFTTTGTQTPKTVDCYTSPSAATTTTDVRTSVDAVSLSSIQPSEISSADLAAPPDIRGGRRSASRPHSPGATPRESLDSAAPPPIGFIRTTKDKDPEVFNSKRSRSSSLGARIGLPKKWKSKQAEVEASTPKPLQNPAPVNSKSAGSTPIKSRPSVRTKPVHDPEAEKATRMAELELLTKSIPYEKAIKAQTPFTSREVADTYPKHYQHDKTKRQIGFGLREEQYMLGAMEEAQWQERERRARMAADLEYQRVLRQGSLGGLGPGPSRARASVMMSGGLQTINEFS